MQLQGAIGVSLMYTRGNSESVRGTLNRSLTIANERGDALDQVKLLATLLADREQRESARALLQPVFEQFAEGFDTAKFEGRRTLVDKPWARAVVYPRTSLASTITVNFLGHLDPSVIVHG